jgi:hypothetical protein
MILRGLREARIVPFLGAGASLVGRRPEQAWDESTVAFLPNGAELAKHLAKLAVFPSEDESDRCDLSKVSSYFVDIVGRPDLRETLRRVFHQRAQPGPLHRFLAEQPKPLVIVVTNYDTLMEQALDEAGTPYDLVVYPADRSDLAKSVLVRSHGASEPQPVQLGDFLLDLEERTVVLKMHGSVDTSDAWDNFVITEEDYIEFVSRLSSSAAIPACFFQYFRERRFLFLGYSLRDWNLRVVLRNLTKLLPARPAGDPNAAPPAPEMARSWAVQYRPSPLDTRLWENRNVLIFDQDLDEFVRALSAVATS